MAPRRPSPHGVAMRLTNDSRARSRPPDNELYDRGCDLVEAALAIRRLTALPAANRAAAPGRQALPVLPREAYAAGVERVGD